MERPSTDTLGFRLRATMRQRGMSNEALASAIGVHPKSISRWLSDKQIPEHSTIARIAAALSTDPGWLLTGRGPSAVGEPTPTGYALSDQDLRAYDRALATVLIRMPPAVYAIAYSFLEELSALGMEKPDLDAAESLFTETCAGLHIPSHPPRSLQAQIEDVAAAVDFLRGIYERRGLIGTDAPLFVERGPDPDAISGAEFTEQLQSRQRKKPKAG